MHKQYFARCGYLSGSLPPGEKVCAFPAGIVLKGKMKTKAVKKSPAVNHENLLATYGLAYHTVRRIPGVTVAELDAINALLMELYQAADRPRR